MGKKLFVGNLPYSATEQVLAETFAQCGVVETVRIITDRETGRSKGFGFVEMATDQEAIEVVNKFNGADYDGRAIVVNEAKPQAPREGGGGRGRPSGGGDRPSRGGFGRGRN